MSSAATGSRFYKKRIYTLRGERYRIMALKVFISSKMAELRDAREIVGKALADRGIGAFVYEESAGARPETVVATSLREVEEADVYVGLFWREYGAVTVEEYRHARKHDKPCFVYIRDRGLHREPELEALLRAEVYDPTRGVTYDYFDSVLQLRDAIARDIMAWLVRRYRTLSAQVRAAEVAREEIERLEAELAQLQAIGREPLKKPVGFISYSHTDSKFADWLAEKLKASGVAVWIDKWEIKVGNSITQKINEGIIASDFLIVVLSRASVNSKWVREELNAATIRNVEQKKHAFILPVLIEECEIPTLLQHRKYANFKDHPAQAFQELLEVIQPTAAVTAKGTITVVPDVGDTTIEVRYQAHVYNVGWMDWVHNGQIAGITGHNRKAEAIRIELVNALSGMGITYQAHVENLGWMDWVSSGEIAGTTGQARQIEAVRIKLTNAPPGYSIAYQAHVQNIGWLDRVYDGQIAGTTGQSRQMEAIRIQIITP